MDVSVIIVNYNTEKLILDCLDSLYAKTEGLSFEVLVVDNASPVRPTLLPAASPSCLRPRTWASEGPTTWGPRMPAGSTCSA